MYIKMFFCRKKTSVFFLSIVAVITEIIYIYYISTRENYLTRTNQGYLFPRNVEKFTPVNESVAFNKYSIQEVDDFIQLFQSSHRGEINVLGLTADEPYDTFLKRLNSLKKRGVMLYAHFEKKGNSSTEKFLRGISQFQMYDPSDEQLMQDLLHDLSTLPIVHSASTNIGTQFTMKLTFSDGEIGFFRPLRVPKDVDSSPDTFFSVEYERHNAEIAAFHIDRILGFNRAGPVVGRLLNITRDLASLISDTKVVDHVYTSPEIAGFPKWLTMTAGKKTRVLGGNLCFIVKCLQKCGRYNPYCGDGVLLEGSVAASLPPDNERTFLTLPYARVTVTDIKAAWEEDENFCENLKKNTSLFEILEFVELAVLDFFTGNLDRHDYDFFPAMKKPTFINAIDNGRGFNNAKVDAISALVPLQQCCQIRLSTLAKLMKLFQGPDSFSQITRASLNSDPLSPILTEAHLEALDRRVGKVIQAVSGCINNGRSWADVVIDDLNPLSNLFSQ